MQHSANGGVKKSTKVAVMLVMLCRFCAKGSLYGLLHSPGCYLSWTEVVDMLLGAARGMEHLHAHSVLHRQGLDQHALATIFMTDAS